MIPNKDWIGLVDDRFKSAEYKSGVDSFLDYAFQSTDGSEIRCPCIKCTNSYSRTRDEVRAHLRTIGIMRGYVIWSHHGEYRDDHHSSYEMGSSDNENDYDDCDNEINQLLEDRYPYCPIDEENTGNLGSQNNDIVEEEPNSEAKKFLRLLDDFKQPLFEGSTISKLSTLIQLLHIKSIGKWSNHSFTMLLKLMKEHLLPKESTLPDSFYEAKKTIKDLGFSYQKIDACVNDCMLFWKEDSHLDKCRICKASRWKHGQNGEEKVKTNGNKIPAKVLRYFPLKPRLQMLFMSAETASLMKWHIGRSNDEELRHPADGLSWKNHDNLYPDFANEPRNVRLGLASDGFQPFNNARPTYGMWPVTLIPYNLPPTLFMKEPYMILSMLIPGPDGPGDAIDVYLQPLIEELQDLWDNGVQTYDASERQNFNLRASLMWTINDFPAYGILSGWSTKGKLACPVCNVDTHSMRLVNGGKECFMGHRRYLENNHPWRRESLLFDGTIERGLSPTPITGEQILNQVQDLEGNVLSKDPNFKTKVSHKERKDNWNKKSIFFMLPYWKDHLIRHTLDMMHIEKNICASILATILNVPNKTKDNHKTRLDLEAMGIRPELHPITVRQKTVLPTARFTLSREGKRQFCRFLKNVKVPDGFSSNISRCVNVKDNKILGLKSHDHHILLHHLLPLALRGLLPEDIYEALIELCIFFKALGSKHLTMDELRGLVAQIPITLCKLEKIFPPSFFDVMLHLSVHLPREAMLCGPVHSHWMYPVERNLYTLKSYIRNMSHPEGSIAEGYIAEECMNFCSRYLHKAETKFNRLDRNYDLDVNVSNNLETFFYKGRGLGRGKTRDLNAHELEQAHEYVLNNCAEVQQFLEEYRNSHQESYRERNISFIEWFKTKVANLFETDKSEKTEALLSLSRGPIRCVTCFYGYVVNGYRFHTLSHEERSRSQCSGVFVVGDDGSGSINYYGKLIEIIELQYLGDRRLVLFRCDWFDIYKGLKEDKYGFTSVDCKRIWKTTEPFILATQASQVFYVEDRNNKGYHIVLENLPRDLYEIEDS